MTKHDVQCVESDDTWIKKFVVRLAETPGLRPDMLLTPRDLASCSGRQTVGASAPAAAWVPQTVSAHTRGPHPTTPAVLSRRRRRRASSCSATLASAEIPSFASQGVRFAQS